MFGVLHNRVIGPVTTSVLPDCRAIPAAVDGAPRVPVISLVNYMADRRASDGTTGALLGSMILVMAEDAVLVDPSPSTVSSMSVFAPGAARNFINLVQFNQPEANVAPANENQVLAMNIARNTPSAGNYLIDLLNAAKKNPLTDKNVEGYFASLGHEASRFAVISGFINQIRSFFPDLVSDAAFRALLAPGVWTTYRVTRVAAASIINKNRRACIALRLFAEGDPVDQAIAASLASPWDLTLAAAIPEKLKGYTCIYLEAAGTPIDNWYQGNKARDAMPAAKVRGSRSIFKRYLEITNNTEEAMRAKDVDDMGEAVRDFWD